MVFVSVANSAANTVQLSRQKGKLQILLQWWEALELQNHRDRNYHLSKYSFLGT